MSSTWRAYDLQFVEHRADSVVIERHANGEVSCAGIFCRWEYILGTPIPAPVQKPGIARFRASIQILRGKVCLGILTPDQTDFFKQVVIEGPGVHEVEIEADCPDGPGEIILRHASMDEGEIAFTLQSLEFWVADHVKEYLVPQYSHHPIFGRFPQWRGLSSPDHVTNWLGTKTNLEVGYSELFVYPSPRLISPVVPAFSEEYFEWIDLLEAVADAGENFTMVELGAGWGRWLVDAWSAFRQIGQESTPLTLIGVEAEPEHYRWMINHFRANGLDPDRHRLIEAAVSSQDGTVSFATGHAATWYGQSIQSTAWHSSEYPDMSLKAVRAVSLATVIGDLGRIDLIDMDIQGTEADVVLASCDLLQERVKRVHIGTHGNAVEAALREAFGAMGWTCLADYPNTQRSNTPYGPITFADGVQSWVNPRFR